MSAATKLTKAGKLFKIEWSPDKQEYVEDKDITEFAYRHLFDSCELEDGVTLRSVFTLINENLDLFDLVLGNWCKEIVTEGLTATAKKVDEYDPEGIEYLELYKCYYKDKDSFHGTERADFHGIGWLLKEESNHYAAGERIPWSVSCSKANDLIDIPLRLDKTIRVFDDDIDNKVTWGHIITTYDHAVYTLGDIVNGIIWELSFHGGPDKRDSFLGELRDTVDKIKSGEEETVPMRDFLDELSRLNENESKN